MIIQKGSFIFALNMGLISIKDKLKFAVSGFVCGILNGLFGAGGGIIIVTLFKKLKIEPKKAHATSISVILPLSIISSIYYIYSDRVAFSDALPFIPGGILGAIAGAVLLKKVPDKILRKVFGALIIIASIRLLLR